MITIQPTKREVRLFCLLMLTFETTCSCFAGIVSLGAVLIAFLDWRVAKKQLTESFKAIKSSDSLEILSCFNLDNDVNNIKGIETCKGKGGIHVVFHS